MMYFNAFEQGLNRLPAANPELRQRLDQEARELGLEALHQRLLAIDPLSASRIRVSDAQRIQRALEVFEITGQPLSQLHELATTGYSGPMEKIILAADDRAALHQRIETRFAAMLEQGFVEEVVGLRHRDDLNLSLPSMRCVGYRQIWQHLEGDYPHQQMIDKAVAATRQLAKRQITWLRKQSGAMSHNCLIYRKDAIFRQIQAAFKGL
jgi:tRNA dimethylallyltransferase